MAFRNGFLTLQSTEIIYLVELKIIGFHPSYRTKLGTKILLFVIAFTILLLLFLDFVMFSKKKPQLIFQHFVHLMKHA